MNVTKIGIVYRKELTDLLRDRRTLMSMIVIPIILFPLMALGFGSLATSMVGKAREEVPQVMVLGGTDSPHFMSDLSRISKIQVIPGTGDYAQQISDKKIRAAIEIPPAFDASIEAGRPAEVKIYYYEGEMKSSFALDALKDALTKLRDDAVKSRLEARNLPPDLVHPFNIQEENVAPPEKVAGASFGGIIPYLVIILCFNGAMYPAIDLTAGEKERGTMETVLSSPISRTDLVLGKYLMVVTASLTTAILAVSSMGISFYYGQGLVSAGSDVPHFTIGINAVLAVLLMVLPISVFFAGLELVVALFAKSFREAQSYVSMLVFVVVIPAVVALLPGIELTARTALIPILNTSLVSKEIVSDIYHWGYIFTIFGTSCVYAGIAIATAIVLFNRESVLFRT
jgi:sodium transport system permease protein